MPTTCSISVPGPSGPRPNRSDRGLTLIELLTVLAVVGVIATLGVPRLLEATARLRVRMAAAEIATALHRTRSYAVCHSARVGLRFDTGGTRVTWRVYRDGDGDGVLSRDIADGTDPPVGPGTPLARLGTSVRFGFPPGPAPRDPGDPRRRLDRLDDPIRFNRSDIASFTPLGGSTPGSVYLTDGRHGLAVVRVYGRTGKLRILVWNPREETWR